MRSRHFLFFAVIGAIAQAGCFLVAGDDSVKGSNDDAGATDSGTDRWLVVDAGADADRPAVPGVVLFAGDGPEFFQDTWQFDGTTWNEDTPATTSPPVRYGHRLAALNGKVILFGGQGLDGFLDDTWSWDGKTWTQLDAPGPRARANMGMTTYQGKILMYGGDGDTSDVGTETWQFDGTSWTQLAMSGPNPGNCIGPAMTALGDKVVLYGGVGAANHTWTWNGTAWNDEGISPIGDRCFMQMAALGDKAYLFGGEQDANDIHDDTWMWNGSTWTQLQISGPPARFQYGMTTYSGKIFLFGGDAPVGADNPFLGDTWSFDGSTWTSVGNAGSGPAGRYPYTLASLLLP